jgi:hypothetical protein
MKSSWVLLCLGLILFSFSLAQPLSLFISPDESTSKQALSISLQTLTVHEVGDTRSFWAVDFDAGTHYIVDAHLFAIGEHCYIYFDDLATAIIGEGAASSRAMTYRDEFDTNIYPRVTDLAGNPNGTLGDIDGDPRIIILIVENRQSYYLQSNEIPGDHSNLCEMIYVCYRTTYPIRTIAHEFDHLVWFNYEFDEVHFILEGAAEYAMYYSGYLPANNQSSRVPYFLNDIDDSLIYFEADPQDYGACYLLTFYLVEQFGLQFLRDLVQHAEDGASGLETALELGGHNITFNELYLNWMTALTIDEPGFAADRFCFQDLDPEIQDYSTIETLPYQDDSVSLYCYGSKVYQLTSPPDSFRVEMSQPTDGIAGLSVAYRDHDGWHVQQIQNEGTAVVQVTGESIETARVIVSYLLVEPPAGEIDFGSGPRESVQLLIEDWDAANNTQTPSSTTDNIDYPLVILAVAMPLSAILAVLFLLLQRKKND